MALDMLLSIPAHGILNIFQGHPRLLFNVFGRLGVPQRNSGCRVYGEYHAEHLPGQPAQLHNTWLHLPHRRRGRDALQAAPGRVARKVRPSHLQSFTVLCTSCS